MGSSEFFASCKHSGRVLRTGVSERNSRLVILTVTPNAAVDKTYQVAPFLLDKVNRPSATHTVAGGKGINVARVYQTLGGKALVTGFLGGLNGRIVAKALQAEQISEHCVRVADETRLCIAIIDPTTGTQSEINERGHEISRRAQTALFRRFESLLSQHRFQFVVCSGSLPPGADEDLYAELIARAKRQGIRTVLDTSGAALKIGLDAQPYLAKPNRAELEGIGYAFAGDADLCTAAQKLTRDSVEVLASTLGADGALLTIRNGRQFRSFPPQIAFASAVASGDSFLAAYLWAWNHGTKPGDYAEALRLATGAGAANAAVIGAGFCTREAISACAAQTRIETLD